jgi:hypothetical protein
MQRRCAEPRRQHRFRPLYPKARLAGRPRVRERGRSNREYRGAHNPMQRRCAGRPVLRFGRVDELRRHPLRAMSKREPQTANERRTCLALSGRGEIRNQIRRLGRKPRFPRTRQSPVAGPGRAAGCSQPADMQPARRNHPDAIFRATETALPAVTLLPKRRRNRRDAVTCRIGRRARR